ncbi:MAG: DUF4249 domain-containing protein [Bacteroidales bacterium]|nr:DUF4249 domain-containing protein [Bacteroidales bacterium]MCB9013867.1 DUF4249 domain-containing protein [Bacteroidales bacterium]
MFIKLIRTLIITGTIFLAHSCTEPYDVVLDSSYTRLIVYGEITSDTCVQKIALSKSADYFYNLPAQPVTAADVTITTGDSVISLLENPQIPGTYETPAGFYGLEGQVYSLRISNVDINNDGNPEEYSASAKMPFVVQPDSIGLNYAVYPFFKGTEILLYARDPAETMDFYAFRVLRNGVLLTDSLPEINVQSDLLFNGNYTYGIQAAFLDDEKEGEKVLGGDTICFEMQGISEEYYKFIIEAQTELFGSNPLFSGPPANISTNISNGALGFFTAISIKRSYAIAPPRIN